MKNENNQNTNGPQKSEDKKHKEVIPLWLQGLKKHEDEDTSPVQVEESSVTNWVSELSEEPQDKPKAQSDQPNEIEESTKAAEKFPDWLSELSEIDPGKPSILGKEDQGPASDQAEALKDSDIQKEEPEDVEIKNIPPEEIPELTDEALSRFPADEDENALTDSEEVEITEIMDENFSGEISQDEELPPWLQEMISEPEEIYPEQATNQEQNSEEEEAKLGDKPTEPVDVSGEPATAENSEDVDEDIEIEEMPHTEEFDQTDAEIEIEKDADALPEIEAVEETESGIIPEPTPSEWVPEDISANHVDIEEEPLLTETSATIVEGDTRPVEVESAPTEGDEIPSSKEQKSEILESEQKQQEKEEQDLKQLPEEMIKTKDLLSEGKIEEAVRFIKAFEDRSTYNQEIQTWLLNASNTVDEPSIDFWELLGDISLENEDHDLAFDAYAKAIKSLLISKEEKDEIGKRL